MMRNGGGSLNSSFHYEGRKSTVQLTSNSITPRPTPQFFNEHQTFSTKKERVGTPRDHQPPRPPVKSAPPISRIFAQKPVQRAQAVSFKSSRTYNSLLNANYKEDSKQLYFDQCFEIDRKIGAGSFGEVFKVRSKADGHYYAVKRSRERFRGESDRKRKLEEVAKHEQLPKHPNCVRFVTAWEERQHLYIQTELCLMSLQQVAESQHNLAERLIWNYVVDLLMAVQHLHDHDLVHMDIKPDNIFITEEGTCKLGDFGLVLDFAKGIPYSEAQEGDPQYLAPELMQGIFSKPADVFSLGITILELASDLDLPRGGDLWHTLRSGHLPEQFLEGISSELKGIIRWMMEPDPIKRPTCSEILQTPFIKKIWRRRRRQQLVQSVRSMLRSVYLSAWMMMLTFWNIIMYPMLSIMPGRGIDTPDVMPVSQHPADWDHSFSEDEAFGDEELNISSSSMGVPLNYSTSSEESFGFPSLPRRHVQTTPAYRLRSTRTITPPSSGSPLLTSGSSKAHSSPFLSPTMSSSRRLLVKTPCSSFNARLAEEPLKLGIEPKNLMDAFEGASSDDDV